MKSSPREKLYRRHARVRAKIRGTARRPRLAVSRSSAHIQAQLIDDEKGVTLFGFSDRALKKKATKKEKAEIVGTELAKKALAGGIRAAVFDRGGYRYHGRVAALADGARKEGLSL